MEDFTKKNKFKSHINQSKKIAEESKNNIFSTLQKTQEQEGQKNKNTREDINEIEKDKKGIGKQLKELLNGYFKIIDHLGETNYIANNIDYYEKELSELIKFSETPFMEETIWRISDNGQFKEYCAAHLRNLLTPFKTIISLIDDLITGKISEDKFKSFIDNLHTNFENNKKDFLEFCDFLENKGGKIETKEGETNKENSPEIDFFEKNIDDNTIQIILNQIIEKEKKKDYYAKGSEGIIFKIEIKDKNGEEKDYLVAKKRFDHNTYKEIHIHDKVQKLMPVGNDIVRVPELKAEISQLNGENYIIMDFIKGKTIYQKIIEEILRKKGLGDFNFKNDSEATNYFGKFLGIERNTNENLNKLDQEYSRLSQGIKLFDSERGKKYAKAIKEFLDAIHNHGIYHRDIHSKNIIIGDDGKLYIIDFGKSIIIDSENNNISKNEIYTEQVGEQTGKYPEDETGISMIKGLTKSKEDEENEEWVKKHIKEEKKLTQKINSGDSVISYFTELPKGFKIQMERKQFLKQVEKEGKYSKRISLSTFLDSGKDELIIYLFAQSLENIENILQEISKQTKICEEEINKRSSDYRAEQPLFRKKYILPYENKIKKMATLKNKLEKIKGNIK